MDFHGFSCCLIVFGGFHGFQGSGVEKPIGPCGDEVLSLKKQLLDLSLGSKETFARLASWQRFHEISSISSVRARRSGALWDIVDLCHWKVLSCWRQTVGFHWKILSCWRQNGVLKYLREGRPTRSTLWRGRRICLSDFLWDQICQHLASITPYGLWDALGPPEAVLNKKTQKTHNQQLVVMRACMFWKLQTFDIHIANCNFQKQCFRS
jgi:hypothetical protein